MGEITVEDEGESNHSNINNSGNMIEITIKTIGPSPFRLLVPSPIKVCLFLSSSLPLSLCRAMCCVIAKMRITYSSIMEISNTTPANQISSNSRDLHDSQQTNNYSRASTDKTATTTTPPPKKSSDKLLSLNLLNHATTSTAATTATSSSKPDLRTPPTAAPDQTSECLQIRFRLPKSAAMPHHLNSSHVPPLRQQPQQPQQPLLAPHQTF